MIPSPAGFAALQQKLEELQARTFCKEARSCPAGDGVKIFLSVLLAITFLLSACAGIQVTYMPLKEPHYAPVRPAKDIILVSGTVPEPYEELGIIMIRRYPGSLEEEVADKFREVARMKGADAVIQIRAERQPVFSLSPFFFSFPFPGVEARGTAVRFKKESGQ